MNQPVIMSAIYVAVAVVFITAYVVEGLQGKPLDRRTTVIVVGAGLLWPLTILSAFVIAVIESMHKEKP